jgi:chromosome segregation ATPase
MTEQEWQRLQNNMQLVIEQQVEFEVNFNRIEANFGRANERFARAEKRLDRLERLGERMMKAPICASSGAKHAWIGWRKTSTGLQQR